MSKRAKTRQETPNTRPYPSREEEPAYESGGSETTEAESRERPEGWGWLRPRDVELSDAAKWDEAKYDQAVWP